MEITTLRTLLEGLRKRADEIKSNSDDPAVHKAIDDDLNKVRSKLDDLDTQAKDKGLKLQVRSSPFVKKNLCRVPVSSNFPCKKLV